ncbi:Metabotropic glutamate receptor 3 [Lobulomyces angularis]|nr:Metabotropic glutamate receptor 3 [Lobulomyces angularis]
MGKFIYLWWIAHLAVDDLNRDMLIPGAQFNLQVVDSKERVEVAVEGVINKMTERNEPESPIIGILGESYSSVSIGVALAANAFKVLQCSGSATSPKLSSKGTYPTFFRTVAPDNYQAPAIAYYIASAGWKKVAVLATNGEYGLYLGQAFRSKAKEIGIDLKALYSYDASKPDWNEASDIIYNSGARIIVLFGFVDDLTNYLRVAKSYGMISSEYVYIASDGMYYDPLQSEVHNATDLENYDGMITFTPNDQSETARYKAIEEKFFNYFKGHNITSFPNSLALFYDCVTSFGHAFFDFLNNQKDKTFEEALDGFSSLDLKNPKVNLTNLLNVDFEGASGEVKFDEYGDPLSALYKIGQYTYGKSKTLYLQQLKVIDGKSGHIAREVSEAAFYGGATAYPSDSPESVKRMEMAKNLENKNLVIKASFVILVEILILAIWTGLDPPKPTLIELPSYSYFICSSKSKSMQLIFNTTLTIYNGLLLLFVSWFAFKTRNVMSNFRETFWIAQLASNIILCGGISLVIINISDSSSPTFVFYVRAIAVGFSASVTFGCLIGRMIVTLVFFEDAPKVKGFVDSCSIDGQSSLKSSTQSGSKKKDSENECITASVGVKIASTLFSRWQRYNLTVVEKYLIFSKVKNEKEEEIKGFTLNLMGNNISLVEQKKFGTEANSQSSVENGTEEMLQLTTKNGQSFQVEFVDNETLVTVRELINKKLQLFGGSKPAPNAKP